MKKRFLKTALISLFAVSFSCEKEVLDPGVKPIISIPPEIPPPFEVVFDDKNHILTNVEAFVVSDGISINAQENKIGTFLISIQGSIEEREYTSSELTILYIDFSGNTYSTVAENDTKSTLTITLIDYQKKRVSGTFSFVGTKLDNGNPTQETKDFSDGKFYNITAYGLFVQP